MNKNRGFTLIELLIYFVLSIMILLPTGRLLKTFLDYRNYLQSGGDQRAQTSYRILSDLGNTVRPSSGFAVYPSGNEVLVYGSASVTYRYYLENGRLKKWPIWQDPVFVTGSETAIDWIKFSGIGSILRVEFSLDGGALSSQGDFFPRNE